MHALGSFRLGLGLIVLGFAFNATHAQTPATESTGNPVKAQLLIKKDLPRVMGPREKLSLEEYEFLRDCQVSLIKTRAILMPALHNPKVAKLPLIAGNPDPMLWLESKLKVVAVPRSELLEISLDIEDTGAAVTIVEAVVEAYLKIAVDEDHKTRIQRLERLKKLYDRYQEELRTKRSSLRMLSNKVGAEDRATLILKQQFKHETLQTLHRELMALQSQLRTMNVQLAQQKADKVLNGDQIAEIEKQVDLAKARENDLLKAIDVQRDEVTKLNGTTIDMQTEKEDIELITETAKKIGQEVEWLDVELQAPRRISVWTTALPLKTKK